MRNEKKASARDLMHLHRILFLGVIIFIFGFWNCGRVSCGAGPAPGVRVRVPPQEHEANKASVKSRNHVQAECRTESRVPYTQISVGRTRDTRGVSTQHVEATRAVPPRAISSVCQLTTSSHTTLHQTPHHPARDHRHIHTGQIHAHVHVMCT